MKLSVETKTGSKQDKIVKVDDCHYRIWTREPAREGRANTAVIKSIAEYLDTPRSKVRIIRGQKSKNKVLEV